MSEKTTKNESRYPDYRTDLQKSCDLWDKAQRDGVFKDAKKPPEPTPDIYSPNYGMSDKMASVMSRSESINDADYWSAIFKLSRGEEVQDRPHGGRLDPNPGADGILHEGSWPSKSPNPIPLWTKGKDQNYWKSHWCDAKDLDRLAQMKEDLHTLGDKLASHDGEVETPSPKSKSIMDQIKKLQKSIDELSDGLNRPAEEVR